jgi:biopolymer transport protein TolR
MAMGSINKSSSRGRRRHGAGFSEINVTPMVDVMLVLLIIFMVAAPMMTVGVPVDLPKTKAAQMNDQIEPIIISVDSAGKTYLQETPIDGEELVARLMAVTSNNPEARIYVRGDQALAYGRVMEVMGEIAAAGFTKVSLIAEMPKGAAPIQQKSGNKQTSGNQRPQANVPTLQQMIPQPARPQRPAQTGSRTPKMSPDQYPTGMLQQPPKR